MRFVGDGFLRHQIRLMVGAALDVVRGGTSLEEVARALAQGKGGTALRPSGTPSPRASPAPQRRFCAASGRGLWLERVLVHDDFWCAKDYSNNRDPKFLTDHGLSPAHWHPARVKRGGGAVAGWAERAPGAGARAGAGAGAGGLEAGAAAGAGVEEEVAEEEEEEEEDDE